MIIFTLSSLSFLFLPELYKISLLIKHDILLETEILTFSPKLSIFSFNSSLLLKLFKQPVITKILPESTFDLLFRF